MKVKGLDGRTYVLRANPGLHPLRSKDSCKSNIQYDCQQLLKEKFPLLPILEEVSLPGTGGLVLDFLLPAQRIAVEIHGRQHDVYVPHFHGSPEGFRQSQARDKMKAEFCRINGIELHTVRSLKEMRALLGLAKPDGRDSETTPS